MDEKEKAWNKFVDKIIDAIETRMAKKPHAGFYEAKVLNVDGDLVWLHIPGGADQTPALKTIDCKKDDTVQIRNGGGIAVLVGNQTAPPTDDKAAQRAQKSAEEAMKAAEEANESAEKTQQYFWFKNGSGDEAGAHVTEISRENFLRNPSGGNLLMRSNSVKIRLGTQILSELSANRMTLASGKAVVKYSEDGQAFGLQDSHRIVVCKGTDEAGVRNDATLSSRDVTGYDMQTMPMAFFNATHKNDNGTKTAAAGFYVFDGNNHVYFGVMNEDGVFEVFDDIKCHGRKWSDIVAGIEDMRIDIAALQDDVESLQIWRGVISSIMTAQVSSYVTLSTSYQKMTLASSEDAGTDLSISSGGIKCTRAGNVLVSGQAHFYGVSDGNVCALVIKRGSTEVAEAKARSAGDRTEVYITPRLISVSANDVIYLNVANTSSATGQAGSNTGTVSDEDKRKNYLTVQYV